MVRDLYRNRSGLGALFVGALASFVFGGCGEGAAVDCGEGTASVVDGQTFCLFGNALIIEGFTCPAELVSSEVPGGVVCGPEGVGLPAELEMPFECMPGDGWCVDEGDNSLIGPANNQTTDHNASPQNNSSPQNSAPGENNEPGPRPDSIAAPDTLDGAESVAILGQTACALTTGGALTCWGDNTSGLAQPPSGVNFEDIALSDGVGCGATASGVVCWGDVGELLQAPTAGEFSRVSVADGGFGCALDASGALACFDETRSGSYSALSGAIESDEKIDETHRFSQLDVRYAFLDARVNSFCGVSVGGSAICISNGSTVVDASGDYSEVKTDNFSRACALDQTAGRVDCWDLLGGDRLVSPPGGFERLYSSSCALRDDGDVVCWGALGLAADGVAPDVVVLYDKPAVAFDLYHEGGAPSAREVAEMTGWCAVLEMGQVECSF